VSRSPEEFYGLLLREGVTVLNQTPSAFRQLMQAEERLATEAPAEAWAALALRTVVFGGEALEPASLRPWYERHGDERPRLVNMYGITETTVHVTYRPLTRADAESARRSVIGWRIPDLRLYVLDGGMRPVPSGVAGELYVGGGGLARGYLNRPGLTAERFTPDPLSAETGARLYRTGDVVRLGAAGELEYLRRADEQVKVRGFRIEPGEVEAALLSHESVREAVVVARDEGNGRQLVAYLVGAPGVAVPTAPALREHLRRALPEYLVPSAFVTLDSLPLTSNGKLDRRALPAPRRESGSGEYVAPRTEAERALAAVWEEVLGAGRAGVEDNFFDLGGDSIRSVRVVALARKLGLNFTLEQLFRHQTIAALLRQLSADSASGGDARPDANNAEATAPAVGPFSLVSREDRERMPADVEDAYPLSMLQAGMLFHGDLNRESALYHNYTSLHLRAPFDARALESAVRRLIERHPVLRTSFDLTGYSAPVQLVHREIEPPLEMEDLRGLSDAEQEGTIARWQDDERQRQIDWSQAPLLRFHVHLRGADTFQFSFAEHHAILDGWSVATMLAELFRSYSSLSSGIEEPDEPPPSSLYRDFVALEQQALTSAAAEKFWRQWLNGSGIITLPRLHTRPEPEQPASTHITHMMSVPLPAELSDGLKRTARDAGVPLKSLLLAAHLRVLSQLGGQEDVVTGMVSHGRPEAADADRALGLYLNTLPFRLRLRGGTWTELAREAFAAEVDAMPFRYYPMAQVKIDQGGRALFETAFNFTHFHVLDAVQSRSEMEVLDEAVFVRTEFALTADFSLKGAGAQVHLNLIGSGEALSREQLESISGYYATALTALADEPSGRYELKSLLSGEERQRLLVEWNDTTVALPEACIHQVFEQEVEQRPDAIALEFEQEQLSYRELNRQANNLARQLRREGVGPEVFVGVMLERSLELIVALLGIAKAAGVYVPINLTDPPKRIRFMLEDAGAKVLVTTKEIAQRLPKSDLTVVCLDGDQVNGEVFDENPYLDGSPDNLAYLMYTSGSTGTPKGVAVTHRNVLRLVSGANYADLSSEQIFLQFAPVSFDASTFEIWGPLLNGARLVIFPPYLPSLARLVDFINRAQVTTLWLTGGLFHQLVDGDVARLRTLKQLLAGGEALSPVHVTKAVEQLNGCQLINGYGPTETTTFACCYPVTADFPGPSVPIGHPISNTTAYVLNAMQPAGVGERGEIYIGGIGLARGYHNRPDLTAERFVPDPFAERPGARLYRTGDVGRHLLEGVVQFIGRLDEQVKISGFRIEPGEIEAALEGHLSVATAVVVVNEETPGDKRLIAYVVTKGEAPPGVDELRAYLKEHVPEYMTPSAFVMLDALPLTSHGKVDRAALPAPGTATGRPGGEYVAPSNAVQRQLVAIWEELFKTNPIGVRDNFFELGGHSLLLMMLVARVEERLNERVAMADVFSGPTIEHLAEVIGRHGRHALSSVIVPMQIGQMSGTRPPLFGLHPGSEEVWCYTELVRRLGADQPFYGIQARRLEAGLVAATEVEAMASDYAEALQEFHPGGPYLLCGWSMGGVIAFEVARQLRARGEHVALLALIDSHAQTSRQARQSWYTLLAILALDLGLAGEQLRALLQEINSLPPPAQLRRVWAETRRAGVVPAEMTLLEFRRLFDTFRANADMMRRYEPGEYDSQVTLIAAEQSLEQDPNFVPFDPGSETAAATPVEPSHGWARLAPAGVDVHVVPGNHFTMMREPFVEALAARLRRCIDEAHVSEFAAAVRNP
jgi:amino acid adenylation domain-containing protein